MSRMDRTVNRLEGLGTSRGDDLSGAERSHEDAFVRPVTKKSVERLEVALRFLLEAKQYADNLQVSPWEFAVELRELRNRNLTTHDLRWLVLKGYVERASETTLPGEEHRSFRPVRGVNFTKKTCFVVTEAGLDALGGLTVDVPHGESAPLPPMPTAMDRLPTTSISPSVPRTPVVPHWDADLQELRINGLIVKQFKVPAPNQEMVLAAFEEEHWPTRIDDPLPPQADQDPKRRLHDTIVSLNRSHKHRMLKFMGDGSGEGVRWSLVKDEIDNDPSANEDR